MGKKKGLSEGNKLFRQSPFNLDGELMNFGFGNRIPSANILETTKNYQLELAAPGLDRKDFKLETDNSILTITVDKKEEKDQRYRRKEFSYNSFNRAFALPENILSDKVDAHYENGVLRVLLPKKEISAIKQKKEIKIA
ncbi:MAG: hypothetical protein A3F72_04200 [Bacteroidetes bacterium RIFCSPLOWO2_12_FULL_35_15]|nr:MAG: hypothetical protein A3F72_04200 [Bacteroidetes bacterium RIFCSPLOWO2_12_FULL_35_15]